VTITSKDIIKLLHMRHPRPAWAAFPELRCGTGFGKRSEQRIDFWAISCFPSEGFTRVAYEVKVSRQDFLNELKDPLKRRGALLVSNQFWFITPPGLVDAAEVPIECGLMEVTTTPRRDERPEGSDWRATFCDGWQGIPWTRVVVDAPVRTSILPTWKFLASVLRRDLSESAVAVAAAV
jgi:hypothetical protein